MELFSSAATQAYEMGARIADLTPIVGDPLIDPTLCSKIGFLRRAGFERVAVTTNAILLGKYARDLIAVGLTDLFVSLPSCDPVDYQRVYGVDKWKEVAGSLVTLLKANQATAAAGRLRVHLRFRNSVKPSRILRSPGFRDVILPYSRAVTWSFTPAFDNWGGTIRQSDLLGSMRLRKAPKRIGVPCRGLFNFKVLHDGKVRLCGCRFKLHEHDDMLVGDLSQSTLSEIVHGQEAARIIEGFWHGQLPSACQDCSFYDPIGVGHGTKPGACPGRPAKAVCLECADRQQTMQLIYRQPVGTYSCRVCGKSFVLKRTA
jgi:MoaA/NifB/PqqE/SkfB family radical SAM enzyme